ncbi:MAG: hypothetical protein HOA21_20165 [Rhodospirillaceae bacterium]|nr:hypothetical protein [Rhodospirillaceae bacterium]
MVEDARRRALELDFWSEPVTLRSLSAGPSGHRFLADDGMEHYIVHIGDDLPEHMVYRYNEIAVSQAAHEAGLSPALLHYEPGALGFEYDPDARATDADDLAQPANMDRLIGLLGQCHLDLPGRLEVPGPMFWVFHLNRRYARLIMQHGAALTSAPASSLARLMALNDELEAAIGAIEPVFCHNNLAIDTVLDNGEQFFLTQWQYGGWNDGLYDLASLATNLDLEAGAAEDMLHRYRQLTGEDADQTSRRRFAAWKSAALIWSGLWGGVGAMFPNPGSVSGSVPGSVLGADHFDYTLYSQQRLDRLEATIAEFRSI